MTDGPPTLPQRRQNAIEAIERLLRVATDHEDGDWIEDYRQILEALKAEADEEAFRLAKAIASRIPKDPESGLSFQPRWVVSEELDKHVQDTLKRLRIHVNYGDQRPLIVPEDSDPDITSRGTRREAWEAERDRDPEEQKRRRLMHDLRSWLEAHRRDAWRPLCEDGDGPAIASKFAGTPWMGPGEQWPCCGCCGRPMDLFLQLNLPELPRELDGRFGDGLLQLFYCRHTASDGDCRGEGYDPFTDCQHVRVVQPDAAASRCEVPPGLGYYSPRTIVGWNRIDDYPRWSEATALGLTVHRDSDRREHWIECPEIGLVSERFQEGTDLDDVIRCDGSDKLAGWPCWIQDVEYPQCPRCLRPMELVFQHTGDALPFMFGDMGIGHITQCPEHKEVVAFGWACH